MQNLVFNYAFTFTSVVFVNKKQHQNIQIWSANVWSIM